MMTDVVCSNGVVLKCDLTLTPGDIITAYHKGFWKVTKVTPRKSNTPVVEYTKIGGKGNKSCDGSYCRKVDPEALYREMVAEADRVYAMLMEAMNEKI